MRMSGMATCAGGDHMSSALMGCACYDGRPHAHQGPALRGDMVNFEINICGLARHGIHCTYCGKHIAIACWLKEGPNIEQTSIEHHIFFAGTSNNGKNGDEPERGHGRPTVGRRGTSQNCALRCYCLLIVIIAHGDGSARALWAPCIRSGYRARCV